jgi:phosphate uptake regulator
MQKNRKLQRIGDTFYVSLPPDWVREHELKKGDKLKVTYDDKPAVLIEIPEAEEDP